MDTFLYKTSGKQWVVTSSFDVNPQWFDSTEEACNYLLTIGVKGDDIIDHALIMMSAHNLTRARFDATGDIAGCDNESLSGNMKVTWS